MRINLRTFCLGEMAQEYSEAVCCHKISKKERNWEFFERKFAGYSQKIANFAD